MVKEEKLLCSHCNEFVAKKTFYKHVKKYFDFSIDKWNSISDSEEECLISNVMSPDQDQQPEQSSQLEEACNQTIQLAVDDVVGTSTDQHISNVMSPDQDQQPEQSSQLEEACDQTIQLAVDDVVGTSTDTELDQHTSLPSAHNNQTDEAMNERKKDDFSKHFSYYLQLWQSSNNIPGIQMDSLLQFINQALEKAASDRIDMNDVCPSSTYTLKSKLGIERDVFNTYIVCSGCYHLYTKSQILYEDRFGNTQARLCNYERFEEGKGSYPCRTQLLSKRISSNGEIVYDPIHTYVYRPFTDSLCNLLLKPDFENLCTEWRKLPRDINRLADVHDGQVWQDFQVVNGRPFLQRDDNYGFAINFDYFNPYKRRSDKSVGVMYLTCLNAPRSIRNKWENVIILGILPSSLEHEPKSINTFLRPFVTEMQSLWVGKKMVTYKHPRGAVVRAALLCVASDSPASRKMCGFLAHSALLGCTKCLKIFKGKVGEKDYSGFDVEHWPLRTKLTHNKHAKLVAEASSMTKAKELERQYGCRYSILIELPYFDAVRQNVLEPMHLLFLGVMKTIFTLLVDRDILTPKKLKDLEIEIRKVTIPYDVGRLPKSIASNWKCFTAQEWKTLILQYIPLAFKSILPTPYYKMCLTFSLACQKICSTCITKDDVRVSHLLFIKFAKSVEQLFGPRSITPNIHSLAHLRNCILDYGSIYAFWAFNFERYNGVLASNPTNKKHIEVQYMRHFQIDSQVSSILHTLPPQFMTHFHSNYELLNPTQTNKHTGNHKVLFLNKLPLDQCKDLWHDTWPFSTSKKMLISIKQEYAKLLMDTYKVMYGLETITIHPYCRWFKHLTCQKVRYGSSTTQKITYIFAEWANNDGNVGGQNDLVLGKIVRFIEHDIDAGVHKTHLFAEVKWFVRMGENCGYLKPASVWHESKYVRKGSATFIPVQRILCRAATMFKQVNGYKCIVAVPLQSNIFV